MNKILAEALSFVETLRLDEIVHDPRIQPFVMAPFTVLREVKAKLDGTRTLIGAQNMHWADAGPWTGEISPLMLKDCSVDIVELGHFERRKHFGETYDTVGLKAEAAVRHGLTPLICIGESLVDREQGRTSEVLESQILAALQYLNGEQKQAPILLAYEPVWAIGENGVPANASYAEGRQAEIVRISESVLGRRVPCLYGGSVNAGNCAELIVCPHVDGLFIGRSAWQVEGFLDIMRRCAAVV